MERTFQFWVTLTKSKSKTKDPFLSFLCFMHHTTIWTIKSNVQLWGILVKINTSKHCAVHKYFLQKCISEKNVFCRNGLCCEYLCKWYGLSFSYFPEKNSHKRDHVSGTTSLNHRKYNLNFGHFYAHLVYNYKKNRRHIVITLCFSHEFRFNTEQKLVSKGAPGLANMTSTRRLCRSSC